MEHAQSETTSLVKNTQFDKSKFRWTIEHFSSLNAERNYSEIFTVGGHKWRLLIFPKGNDADYLSIYLDVPDSTTLPDGWSKYADFSVRVVNKIDPELTIEKETNHLFNAQESDWGFTSFISLPDVRDLTKGYLEDDTLNMEAEVSAQRVIDFQADDSKNQTGFDGQKDQKDTDQSETVSLVENTQFDKFTFKWAIEHFSSFNAATNYSEIFTVGDHKWRLLIFPKGNDADYLSIYLDVPDSTTFPDGWSIYADFSVRVVNKIDPELTIEKETNHLFNAQESDWGFTSFLSLSDIHDLTKGYLVDDTLIVEAEVSAQRVIDYQPDDSKKQTGFDGLKKIQETIGPIEAASPSRSSEVDHLSP